MDHLSISARQELKTLLEADFNRVVEQRVLPDHYYSQLVIKNMVTNCILNHDQYDSTIDTVPNLYNVFSM